MLNTAYRKLSYVCNICHRWTSELFRLLVLYKTTDVVTNLLNTSNVSFASQLTHQHCICVTSWFKPNLSAVKQNPTHCKIHTYVAVSTLHTWDRCKLITFFMLWITVPSQQLLKLIMYYTASLPSITEFAHIKYHRSKSEYSLLTRKLEQPNQETKQNKCLSQVHLLFLQCSDATGWKTRNGML